MTAEVIDQARKRDCDNDSEYRDEETNSRSFPQRAPRVVLAEDESELRCLIAEVLRNAGYEVVEVQNGCQLRERLNDSILSPNNLQDADLIISDIRMPGMTGFDAMSDLVKNPLMPPIILITAFGDQQTFLRAARLGAVAFFDKPIDLDKFLEYVLRLIPPFEKDERSLPKTPEWNPGCDPF